MKAEAERLADALAVPPQTTTWVRADGATLDAAISKLRQWSDGEPVAWQERQAITSTGNWSHWYDCKGRSKSDPLEMVEPNGLHFQWRPLYTAPPDQSARIAELASALRFYAAGDHFDRSDDAWGAVSGEPQNFWCDAAGTATVEDGAVARAALAGVPLEDERISELERQRDAMRYALRRITNVVALHLGIGNQTKHLKGYTYGQEVLKELHAAYDAAIKAAGGGK